MTTTTHVPTTAVPHAETVADEQMRGRSYGEIPWRLGLLTPAQ